MAKYTSEYDGTLYFPSLHLTVNKGDVFECADDLSGLHGIIAVEDKKASKKDAVEDTPSSEGKINAITE